MSQPPFPCPTRTWHNDTYADIDPGRPELSVEGKRIVITGGGTGIGRATAIAFAAAGAASILLLGGRREALLKETKEILGKEFSNVKVTYTALDIRNVSSATGEIGKWDVLILNAGFFPTPGPFLQADLDDEAKGWTINLLGNMQVVHNLLPHRKENAVVIASSSGIISLENKMLYGNAVIASAKLALSKFMEVLSVEVPDCRWVTIHPGIVDTDMLQKSGFKGAVPEDTATLPAHFCVWLTSPEAAYLNGKFVWSNWDVSELKQRAEEIQNSQMLTTNIVGWPFQNSLIK